VTEQSGDYDRIAELMALTGLTREQVEAGLPLAEIMHQASFHMSEDQIEQALLAAISKKAGE
jgi:hypothetical protein